VCVCVCVCVCACVSLKVSYISKIRISRVNPIDVRRSVGFVGLGRMFQIRRVNRVLRFAQLIEIRRVCRGNIVKLTIRESIYVVSALATPCDSPLVYYTLPELFHRILASRPVYMCVCVCVCVCVCMCVCVCVCVCAPIPTPAVSIAPG
jgi:hypothetical protein